MAWLEDYPICVVNAHAEMLQRIDASEALQQTARAAIGHGLKGGDWMNDTLKAWRDAVGHEPAQRGGPVPSHIGIAVRKVRKRG